MNYLEDKKTKLVSTKELLSGQNCYRIPDYQRGYAWTSQLEDLWKDIIRILENGGKSKHYTGMLSLEKLKEEDKKRENLVNINAFYVVDGQQRLTSLIIIIKCLVKYIKREINEDLEGEILTFDNGNTYRFGYSVDRSDDAEKYFESRIFKEEKNEVYSDMYLKNIDDAEKNISRKLLRYDAEIAKEILKIVLNQIVFNIYFIDEEFDVRVTFETMNIRGKKLSNLELLKNRLMYLSTFFNVTNITDMEKTIVNPNYEGRLKKKINDAWNEIYKNIYYKKNQIYNEVEDDIYLQAHWIVYGSLDKSKGNTYIRDILEKKFSIDGGDFYNLISEKKYDEAFYFISKYIESLSKYSKFWKIINSPIENGTFLSGDEVIWLDRLNRITTMKYIKPVIMVIMGEKSLDSIQKIRFYKSLERNLFINKILYHSKNDYSSLVTIAKEILNAKEDEKVKKLNKLIGLLENKDSELYCYDIEKVITKFSEYINERRDSYYGWDGINYFLYEYNESLSRNSDTKEIDWNESSIEHILPQKITREYWKIILNNIEDNEKNIIINALGNLLLLSKGENSELQNYSFPTKKNRSIASKKFAYEYGSRSAQEIAKNYYYWSLNDIYKRQIKLFEFMFERWIKEKKHDNNIDNFENTKVDEKKFINMIKEHKLMLKEYKELTHEEKEKLDELDLSDEESSIKWNEEEKEDWYEEIKEVFDTNVRKNKQNMQYIENRFTFTKKNEFLKCGTRIDEKKYYFEYNYSKGFIKIFVDGIIQTNEKNLPEKARYFLRTFNRFLREQENRDNAKIYNNSTEV